MTTIAASWLNWAEPRLSTNGRSIAVLLIGAGILALTLAVPAVKRGGRTLVTVVHEAGHAVVGIACGRRFQGFVVQRDMSGHAVTKGKPTGPGRILTTWAGYPAPALLGAFLVVGALSGWSKAIVIVTIVALIGLLVMSRSVRTVLVILGSALVFAALWQLGDRIQVGALAQAGVVAGIGLILLIGAWTSLQDVARTRDREQDHFTLAALTRMPSWIWILTWFLVDLAASAWAVHVAFDAVT